MVENLQRWRGWLRFVSRAACFCFLIQSFTTFAATYVVDANGNSGAGTFNQAILDANANAGTDTISFAISGTPTITPGSLLPTITDPVIIDATTQTGYSNHPIVGLNGSNANGGAPGLHIICGNSTVTGLAIFGFKGDGILIETNGNNTLSGNYIGVNTIGATAGNKGNGVTIAGAAGNFVVSNVISANLNRGILLINAGANSNVVTANFIGTDTNGRSALPNATNGVAIVNGFGNRIGGADAFARNIISGNGRSGVFITSLSVANIVSGNYIGVDSTGTNALGNSLTGLAIDSGSTSNIIGGFTAGERNVISANQLGGGVSLKGAGTSQNQIFGNFIGTDASGLIGLGNVDNGIAIFDFASNNIVGGTVAGAGNLVSANGLSFIQSGIYITNVSGTLIHGNFVGTKADGISALGNGSHGVEIYIGNSNTIGGIAPGAGNRIAFAKTSQRSGVRIRNGTGNLISGNMVFSNACQGIDLGIFDVTANDGCDGDGGANNLQNFPVLNLAASDAASVGIKGTLNSTANTTYRLQFFANSSANVASGGTSGYGQGEVFLGETTVTTDGSCSNAFTATLTTPVPAGKYITATATDPANNTSEFSGGVSVVAAPTLALNWDTNSPFSGQFTLSWPTSTPGFSLEQTGSLTPPVEWLPVTNTVVVSGTSNIVTLATSGTNQFFRLSFK
ncbi:MAG: hypothetical protein QOD03_475 [Verrucomicrobiota bacterium]|jgi:hypothetical protein